MLEGPPGTGKSQTITNLIAHALSKGKTVLFVAEKQAALDVSRSVWRGSLSDFTLDLHGKNKTRTLSASSFAGRSTTPCSTTNSVGRHGSPSSGPGTHRSTTTRAGSTVATASTIRCGAPTKPRSRSATDRRRQCRRLRRVPDGCSQRHRRALESFARAARSVEVRPGSPWGSSAASPTSTRWNRFPLQGCVSPGRWMPPWPMRRPGRRWTARRSGRTGHPASTRQAPGRPYCPRLPRSRVVARACALWGRRDALSRKSLACTRSLLRSPASRHFTPMFLEWGNVDATSQRQRKARTASFSDSIKKKKKKSDDRDGSHADDGVAVATDRPSGQRSTSPNFETRCAVRSVPYAPPVLESTGPGHLQPRFDRRSSVKTVKKAERDPNAWARLTPGRLSDEHGDGDPGGDQSHLVRRWRRVLGTHADNLARWKQDEHWTVASRRGHRSTWRREIAQAGSRRLVNWGRMSALPNPLRTAPTGQPWSIPYSRGDISTSDAEVAFIRGAAEASVTERRHAEA